LSPLEIGLHALKAVPKAEGGRGKKGGGSAYATRLGKDESYIRQLRNAAEVYTHIRNLGVNSEVLAALADPQHSRAQHLSAIHKAPVETWAALKAVPLEKGGRGKKGGLSEYAARLGYKNAGHVTEYRQAAEVYQSLNHSLEGRVFLPLARHLAAVHHAPSSCWQCLAAALVEANWNVADTEEVVSEVVKAPAPLSRHFLAGVTDTRKRIFTPFFPCSCLFLSKPANSKKTP
jgi:hypothetical protein